MWRKPQPTGTPDFRSTQVRLVIVEHTTTGTNPIGTE